MIILYILLTLLASAVLVLSMALLLYIKKGTYLSEKEKEFIVFVMDIYKDYGDELGVQSKEQHKKLIDELEKIKVKHFKIKKDEQTK
jgi:hypothetical protein